MNDLWQKIIDIFLPPYCLKCHKILTATDSLCPECFHKIQFISAPYCPHCGVPLSSERKQGLLCAGCSQEKEPLFRMNRAGIYYDKESRPLILDFKFRDKTENAPLLAKWMVLGGRDIFQAGVDVIIPIPLHYTRMIKRRYNQSVLLAKELTKITGIANDFQSVIRHRKTKPQVDFSGKERIYNVKNAFCVKYPQNLQNKRVLLIDDVMTTGSTLRECAKVIKAAGAKSIDSLTIARVIK